MNVNPFSVKKQPKTNKRGKISAGSKIRGTEPMQSQQVKQRSSVK
jgi:hypothetical protein